MQNFQGDRIKKNDVCEQNEILDGCGVLRQSLLRSTALLEAKSECLCPGLLCLATPSYTRQTKLLHPHSFRGWCRILGRWSCSSALWQQDQSWHHALVWAGAGELRGASGGRWRPLSSNTCSLHSVCEVGGQSVEKGDVDA